MSAGTPPPSAPWRREGVLVARLLAWLPAQFSVCRLSRVSRSANAAVRQRYEVEAPPGADVRALLAERMPEFGTLRVPRDGVALTGTIREPLTRSVRIAPASARGRRRTAPWSPGAARAPLRLTRESIYGLVEFRCARLCLDGLRLQAGPARGAADDEAATRAASAAGEEAHSQALYLAIHEAVTCCRNCAFEGEVTLMPPLHAGGAPLPSLFEHCVWEASPGQGLVIHGMRPGGCGAEEPSAGEEALADAALAASGLRALRRFAGDLDLAGGGGASSAGLVVPNGLRLCVVRSCEARGVKLHALFLRWDVFVLVEQCDLHGKVYIEEGSTAELRQNSELVIAGERLPAGFVGLFRAGRLRDWPSLPAPPGRRRRRATTGGGGRSAAGRGRSASAGTGSARPQERDVGWAPAGGASAMRRK